MWGSDRGDNTIGGLCKMKHVLLAHLSLATEGVKVGVDAQLISLQKLHRWKKLCLICLLRTISGLKWLLS